MARPLKILAIAPHNDDETLGCGGTLAKHVKKGHDVYVAIFTSISEDSPIMTPNKELVRKETKQAMKILGIDFKNVIFKDLPNALLPDIEMYKINKEVFEVIHKVKPDILYLPFMKDLHNDHRLITYAAQVAARSTTQVGRNIKEIYMYETLSETHWNIDSVEGGFLPNVYIDITGFLTAKLKAIKAYKSQLKIHPDARSVKALSALATLRGSIVGMREAEAFVLVRKLNW